MKTQYAVKFTKWFVSGNLSGIAYDSILTFPTLELACKYVSFCHEHRDIPVQSIDSSNYTIHMARIETYRVSPENEDSCLKVGR